MRRSGRVRRQQPANELDFANHALGKIGLVCEIPCACELVGEGLQSIEAFQHGFPVHGDDAHGDGVYGDRRPSSSGGGLNSPSNLHIIYFMCRNIKTLANFCPPATEDEIRASALQFVRKLSGMNKPSRANEAVFAQAVEDVTAIARKLVSDLVITSPPRNREEEAQKARERARVRFAS